MRVYKYTNSKYCSPWSFRLGTLYDYRKEEEYGRSIGDKGEGSHSSNFSTTFDTTDDFARRLYDEQDFPAMYVKALQKDGGSTFVFTSCNLLVFSAICDRNDDMYAEFKGTDCCVSISNFELFSKALVSSMDVNVEKWLIKKCEYGGKKWVEQYGAIPSLPYFKDIRYSYQKEVRLCVQLYEDVKNPVIVSPRGMWKYCKIINKKSD